MQPNWWQRALLGVIRLAVAAAVVVALSRPVEADPPTAAGPALRTTRVRASADSPGPDQILVGPTVSDSAPNPSLAAAQPTQQDQPLPINLATALQLSNARPLVIAFAQARVEEAAALLQGANVLWLPNINIGIDSLRHDGADQSTDGTVIFPSKNTFAAGIGATIVFNASDAIFLPLAARQVLLSRRWDVQSASNDALLDVAAAYFDVQQARGQLAASLDAVEKAESLVTTIQGLSKGFVAEIEVDRARSVLYDLRQEATARRAAWRVASARLARVLRLTPSVVAVPLEPPHLQVTLIAPESVVDDLVAVGLLNRPELESQKALVQATLERLRLERVRPLLPSVVLAGRGPGGAFNGDLFAGGKNDNLDTWGGRFDVEVAAVWTLNNFGLGNRALVRTRSAQREQALIQLFDVQDRVAQEVVQAHAELMAAARQVRDTQTEVNEGARTFAGSMKGLGEPRRVGDVLILIVRPQEAVAALQQLDRAYQSYFAAVGAFNRSQFQLYHAVGLPSRIVVSERPVPGGS